MYIAKGALRKKFSKSQPLMGYFISSGFFFQFCQQNYITVPDKGYSGRNRSVALIGFGNIWRRTIFRSAHYTTEMMMIILRSLRLNPATAAPLHHRQRYRRKFVVYERHCPRIGRPDIAAKRLNNYCLHSYSVHCVGFICHGMHFCVLYS